MKVILLKDIKKLGDFGQQLEVANGYARNCLLPKKLAALATPVNIKRVQQQLDLKLQQNARLKAQTTAIAGRLEKMACTITKRVGENDRLFGSVTSIDIAKNLKQEGLEINKRNILLPEPLKALGIYDVPVRLDQEITVNLKVWVVKG